MEERIAELPGVSTVTHRLTFSGLGAAGNATVNVSVVGVDLEGEQEFSDFEILVEGRPLDPGDVEGGLIGEEAELRNGLGAEVGDWVTVLTSSLDGIINAVDFKVAGVVRSGSKEYDSVFVKVPIELAQRARETDKVERIIVLLEDTDDLPEPPAPDRGGPGRARPQVRDPPLGRAGRLLRSGGRALHGALQGVRGDRRRGGDVLGRQHHDDGRSSSAPGRSGRCGRSARAAPPWSRCSSSKGSGSDSSAAASGVAAAWLLAGAVEAIGGIPMPPPPGMTQGFQAYFSITGGVLLSAFAVTIVATLVSSVYPAFAASRIRIVEALQPS